MEELDIDREFAAMCPALTPEEFKLLEEGIIADGCRDPIVLWRGLILDGHNRYEICTKHKLTFKTKTLNLPDREAAVKWIARNQLGRRNLNESQRAMLAARMMTATHGGSHRANLPDGAISSDKSAEICNVSARLVTAAKKVVDQGSAALQSAVAAGSVSASAGAAVATLPKAEQRKVVAKGPEAVKAKAKEITEAKKYKDDFDTDKLDKELAKDKKPGSVKKKFNDKEVDDLFGKIARLMDQRWNETGGHNRLYQDALKSLRAAMTRWGEWKSWKGAL